jgi:addiction module HigA family antidote
MVMCNPPHPGTIVRLAMGKAITITAMANHLGATRSQISMILNGRAGISPLMGLKLDEAFGKSQGFFAGLQADYDLAQALKVKRKKVARLQPSIDLEEAA